MMCPVCYSDADPIVTQSLNSGILVLLGVTGVVLGGIARFALSIVRRARAMPDYVPQEEAR